MGSTSLNTFLIHTSQLVGGKMSVKDLTGTLDGEASSFPRMRRAIGGLLGLRLNDLSTGDSDVESLRQLEGRPKTIQTFDALAWLARWPALWIDRTQSW